MNWKKTLAVLAVLIAGGVYIYFGEYRAGEKKAKEQADAMRIFPFAPSAVTKVAIADGDREIALEKEKDGWRITSPVSAKGDTQAINALIETAAEGTAREFMEGTLADFGLEPATMKIEFYHGGEKPDALRIGSPSPTGTGIYVHSAKTGKIALMDGAFANNAAKNLYQLRDKHLVDGDIDMVSKVEIAKGPSVTSVEKDKDGNWRIAAPAASADTDAVRGLIRSLLTASATGFADGMAAKEAGLHKPRLRITLWQGDAKQTVLFGGESSDQLGIFATLEGSQNIAILPGALYDELARSADGLRGNRVFMLGSAEVEGVSIIRGGAHLRLIRENGAWHFVVPEKRPADSRKVEDMLSALSVLEWDEKLTAPGKGPLFCEISLEIFGPAGKKVRVSFIAHTKDKTKLAAVRDEGAYLMDAGALQRLLPAKMEDLLK